MDIFYRLLSQFTVTTLWIFSILLLNNDAKNIYIHLLYVFASVLSDIF